MTLYDYNLLISQCFFVLKLTQFISMNFFNGTFDPKFSKLQQKKIKGRIHKTELNVKISNPLHVSIGY